MKKYLFMLFAALLTSAFSFAETGTETEKNATGGGSSNAQVDGQSYFIAGGYIAGTGSAQTGDMTSKGFKLRTGTDGKRAVFTVQPGYTITSLSLTGASNYELNDGGTKEVSVSKVEVDGVEVGYTGGEAFKYRGQGVSCTLTVSDIAATESIAIYFDNGDSKGSQINASWVIAWERPDATQPTITVTPESVTLIPGASFKLGVRVDPANFVTKWVSSDESIATVAEDGTVTAVTAGKTTIRNVWDDNADVFAEATVNVTDFNADDYAVAKSYDFTALGDITLTIESEAAGNIWNEGNNKPNAVYFCTNEGLEDVAVQAVLSGGKGWSIISEQGLVLASGAGRCAAIGNLKAGQVVEIIYTGSGFYTGNREDAVRKDDGALKTPYNLGIGRAIYRMDEDGLLGFEIEKGKAITKVTVYEEASEEPVGAFDYEKIAINPAEGQVEQLYNFTISFGGQTVTINEDALLNLTKTDTDEVVAEAGIELNADGTVSVGLSDKVTAAGKYTLNIPENAIFFNGKSLDPLAFKYQVGTLADYTIDPAEGEVESLSSFIITFNNYLVEVNEEEAGAILFNTETEEEVNGSIYAINGGKQAWISLDEEVTAPGSYELIVLDASLKKLIDDTFVPELAFQYTIAGSEQPAEAVLVEVPADVEIETWTLEGNYVYDSQLYAEQLAVGVAIDGNDIYVQHLAEFFPEAWIKGTINGNVATFPAWQFVGEDEYGQEYLLGTQTGEEAEDIIFAYDADAQKLTLQNFILENDGNEEIYFWGYWQPGLEIYAGEPVVVEPVTAPADLATETYVFKAQALEYGYEDDGFQDYQIQVEVGFDGDDLYIQGIAQDVPELFVKATKNAEGQYVIPANQYMGDLSFWGYTFPYYFTATNGANELLDVVLNYDAETQTITSDQYLALNGAKNALDYYLLYQDVVITKFVEVAATPVDPEVVTFEPTAPYPYADFDIPAVGTNGEDLNTAKLFYIIWIEKDGEQQPLTLTADLYDYDFTEDVTEIPYNHDEYDVYKSGARVYLIQDDVTEWTKIGVQSVYYGAGERLASNIAWSDGTTTGISHIAADSDDVRYFDLQGRRVAQPAKGRLYIANGKKVVVK